MGQILAEGPNTGRRRLQLRAGSKATSRPQQRGENRQASRDDAGAPSLHRRCRQTQLMTTTNCWSREAADVSTRAADPCGL